MAPRAKLVRNLTFAKQDSKTVINDLMTPAQFTTVRKLLMRELRAKDDPPPRMLNHGTGDTNTRYDNVTALLERTPGGEIVRGYKMYVVPLDPAHWGVPNAWTAIFHMVVSHKTESGKLIYECATAAHVPSAQHTTYVFIPSSRAHADISDADFLANLYWAGCVVGGNPSYAESVCVNQQVRGRRYSSIAQSPEECVARRDVTVIMLPHFAEWFRMRGVAGEPQILAEQMGMPTYNAGEHPDADRDNIDVICHAVQTTADSLINGMVGVQLEQDARRELYKGTTTFERVRLQFLEYYDDAHRRIGEIQEARYAARQH